MKKLKKELGQYFLRDPKALVRIITALQLNDRDIVLEIGAGSGVVTVPVAKLAKKVIAVEIDPDLCAVLDKELELEDLDNAQIFKMDFLEFDLTSLPSGIKIVSNLPYYITSPIIAKIFLAQIDFSLMVLTMQEEAAARIMAQPGQKKYGVLSVAAQFYTDIEIVAQVPNTAFYPVPEVDSCVVTFSPHKKYSLRVPEKFLWSTLRRCFRERRKMLRKLVPSIALERASVDGTRRAETLSVAEFCCLTEEIYGTENES